MIDMDIHVGNYVALRDKIKALDEAHEEHLKPFKAALEKTKGILMAALDESGSEAVKTANGTCYGTTRYSASLADGEAFKTFVLETERYDLLDWKANATAVRDYVEEHKALPPGCNLSAIKNLGVRRS